MRSNFNYSKCKRIAIDHSNYLKEYKEKREIMRMLHTSNLYDTTKSTRNENKMKTLITRREMHLNQFVLDLILKVVRKVRKKNSKGEIIKEKRIMEMFVQRRAPQVTLDGITLHTFCLRLKKMLSIEEETKRKTTRPLYTSLASLHLLCVI